MVPRLGYVAVILNNHTLEQIGAPFEGFTNGRKKPISSYLLNEDLHPKSPRAMMKASEFASISSKLATPS